MPVAPSKTYLSAMTHEQRTETLRLHAMWLRSEEGGVRADLRGADLRDADLRFADLRRANLSGADLRRADLSFADMSFADMSGADMSGADLRFADLRRANLRFADMSGADMSGADMSGADMSDADLSDADLSDATGNMREVRSIHVDRYAIVYTVAMLRIGCQRHSIDEWRTFDDETISAMDNGALEWWQTWKDWIFRAIELAPATPTGHEEVKA